ncbi:MAG TPA: TonB family protein [Myxococcaceae bacterium]|nr:TonB family protein [Myxococcaceae bacterium]
MFDVARGRTRTPTRLRSALVVSLTAHAVLLVVAIVLSRPAPRPQGPIVRVRPPPGLRAERATPGAPVAQGHQPGPRRPSETHPLQRRPRPATSVPALEEASKEVPGGGEETGGEGPEGPSGAPECATPPCDATSSGVFTEDIVAEMPLLLSGPDVALSAEARRAGVEGTMLVRCVITTAGTVEACEVLKGLPLADAAVLAALRARQYRPAQVEGRAVSVRHLFTVHVVRGR